MNGKDAFNIDSINEALENYFKSSYSIIKNRKEIHYILIKEFFLLKKNKKLPFVSILFPIMFVLLLIYVSLESSYSYHLESKKFLHISILCPESPPPYCFIKPIYEYSLIFLSTKLFIPNSKGILTL